MIVDTLPATSSGEFYQARHRGRRPPWQSQHRPRPQRSSRWTMMVIIICGIVTSIYIGSAKQFPLHLLSSLTLSPLSSSSRLGSNWSCSPSAVVSWLSQSDPGKQNTCLLYCDDVGSVSMYLYPSWSIGAGWGCCFCEASTMWSLLPPPPPPNFSPHHHPWHATSNLWPSNAKAKATCALVQQAKKLMTVLPIVSSVFSEAFYCPLTSLQMLICLQKTSLLTVNGRCLCVGEAQQKMTMFDTSQAL